MKAKKPEPGSKEFLDAVRRILKISDSTGHLVWVGSDHRAGLDHQFSHVRILIDGRKHLPENIAWLLHTETWPAVEVGFKNGIDTDFRSCNLFQVLANKQLTISEYGNLFVVMNGSEQVLATENLDECVQMVRDVLEG